jgi:hypothetical protein
LSTGDVSRVDLALEDTVQSFLGPNGQPSPGGTGFLVSQIPADVITNDESGTAINRDRTRSISAAVARTSRIGRRSTLTHSLSFTHANSRYLLPQGAGILTDPMVISFSTNAVEAESELAWSVIGARRYSPRLTVGAGAVLMQSLTRIDSALLAVPHRRLHHDFYGTLGIQQPLWSPKARPPGTGTVSLHAKARIYSHDRAAYIVGTSIGF